MTLPFHYSPRLATWARCQAKTPETCPFGGDAHGDRTAIATKYGGGVVSYLQDGVIKEFTVTPVIEGIYGVINRDGDSRTYTTDGRLITHHEREAYLRDVILPRVRARHYARLMGEGRVQAEVKAEKNEAMTVKPMELPTSVLTMPKVKPGVAGRKAREAEAQAAGAAVPIRGLPSQRQAAKAEKEKRQATALGLRRLFRRAAKAQREQVAGQDDLARRAVGEDLRRGLLDWFFDAFGLVRRS